MGPKTTPKPQHIETTSCVKLWDATIGADELADISSYQTLPGGQNFKSYSSHMKLDKQAGAYMLH